MSLRVAIINYRTSNLYSVCNAFTELGAKVEFVDHPGELSDFSHIVMPGVGSFPVGMERLNRSGLAEAICEEAEKGMPVLGLCLGMHLLGECGSELGETKGLGLIPGRVGRIPSGHSENLVPNIGWNRVYPNRDSRLFNNVAAGEAFYFVHSFAYQDSTASYVLALNDAEKPMVAAVEQGNIFGLQFHPEKSQKSGLKILANFLSLN